MEQARSTSPNRGRRCAASTTARSRTIPFYGCYKPLGVPRQNVPGRIVQKDKQIWLFNNVENALRVIPLDDRKRDENDYQFSTYSGMGLTHWEGDTLVVESVGFNGVSWIGWEGYFHTDKMEVTERFTRNGDLLYYNFTVTDPDVLMEPWTSITYVRRLNPNPRGRMKRPSATSAISACSPIRTLRGWTRILQLTDLRIYEFSNLNDHLKVTSLRHISSGCSTQRN